MACDRNKTLGDNLLRLQVGPVTAQLLQAHEPVGCRLDALSDTEARLFYNDQAIYGGENILATVADQSRDLLVGRQPGVVVFFGLGLGFHVAAIRQHTEVPIVVFEPSQDLAAFVLARISVELDDVYLVGDSEALAGVLYTLLQERHEVVAGAIPSYRELFASQFDDFFCGVNEAIERQELIRSTRREFAETWVTNLAENLPFLGSHKSLSSLGRGFVDRPAIMVGAGPSLDRNIKELAAAKGRALIVAVHSAVQPLAKAGIVPDLVVIIEGQQLGYYFEDVPQVASSVLLASPRTHPEHLAFGFKEILALNMSGIASEEWLSAAYGDRPLPSGGSVACTAFAALHELGCNPIALVGMDTAYRSKRGHAQNSHAECCEFSFDAEKETITNHCRTGFHQPLVFRLQMVPAWGGVGEVATRPALATFRLWFEAAASSWAADRMLINATEGGARIQGLREMTLADCLAEFCDRDLPTAEMIAAGLAEGPERDPGRLAVAVQNELGIIDKAEQAARRADQAAAKVLAKLRLGQLSTVQPLLDRLSRHENELRALSRQTRLLNTLVAGGIEDLATDKVSGDQVAQTIHSVAQSQRASRLVIEGAQELLSLFEPAVRNLIAGKQQG